MDYIDGSTHRFVLYKLKECPPAMTALIEVIHLSVIELKMAFRCCVISATGTIENSP